MRLIGRIVLFLLGSFMCAATVTALPYDVERAVYYFDDSIEVAEASSEFDAFHPEKFEKDGVEYIGFPLQEAKEISIRLIEKSGNDDQIRVLKEIVELQNQHAAFKDEIILNYKEQFEICKDAFKEANEASKPSFWDRKPVIVVLTFVATTAAIYVGKELAEQ